MASARIIHISDLHFTSSSRTLDSGYILDNLKSTFRSAQLSDYLIANKALLNSSTVVMTGDLTDSGDLSDIEIAEDFLDKLTAAGFKVYPVPGNHDYSKEGNIFLGQRELGHQATRFENFKGHLASNLPSYPTTAQIDDTILVLLDSLQGEFPKKPDHCAQGRLGPKQLAWLKTTIDDLQSKRKVGQKVVVCLHHSPFHLTEGTPLSTMIPDSLGGLGDAKEFIGIVENRIDCLLFGHTSPAGMLQQGFPDFAIQQKVHGIPFINCENLEHIAWFKETPLRGKATQVCAARNRNGKLEAFYVGTNGKVFRNYQTAMPGWKGESALGGLAKQICVGQNQDGGLHIVYVGTNDLLYQNRQDTKTMEFTGEAAVGGSARQVCIGRNQDGRLEILYVGLDGRIFHNRQKAPNGDWAGEAPLGGMAQQICVGQHPDGRLEIFYVGTNYHIYHNWQKTPNGDWAGEAPLDGEAVQLCVEQNADGRLEIFYIGTNWRLYHNWEKSPNGPWSGEEQLGGQAVEICVEQNPDGRLELVYVGTNSCIYHNFQISPNGPWAGEQLLERPIDRAKEICMVENADGRLEIFYVGMNNDLFHNWQTIPGAAYPITVIDLEQGRREVFTTSNTTPVVTTAF